MEMWCIKPGNKEEAFIISKWFDENWGNVCNNKMYQTDPAISYYYIYGIKPGDVYYTRPKGNVLTFQEFQTEILKQNVEPNYEIY